MDSNQELAFPTVDFSADVLEAAEVLAQNISQASEVLGYVRAENTLQADSDALHLLQDLNNIQQKIRELQYNGSLTQTDISALRDVQAAVFKNQTIQNYLTSQEVLKVFLRDVNNEISQLIGTDFASLTRQNSSC